MAANSHFHHGLSLLSGIKDYPLSKPINILKGQVKAKPFSSSLKKQLALYQGEPFISYNRWAIVRKTHGVMADDEIWLRFRGETLKQRDVTLRKHLYYPDDSNSEQ